MDEHLPKATERAGIDAHGAAAVVYSVALVIAAISALALPGRRALER